MRPRTVKWLARPSVALAQALALVGPFPAFGQATSGLACGWPPPWYALRRGMKRYPGHYGPEGKCLPSRHLRLFFVLLVGISFLKPIGNRHRTDPIPNLPK